MKKKTLTFPKSSVEAKILSFADDLGGLEIFNEENKNRLKKALMDIPHKKLTAILERLLLLSARSQLQFLYSLKDETEESQRNGVKCVVEYMEFVGFSEDVSYETVMCLSHVLGLPEPQKKRVEVEKHVKVIDVENAYYLPKAKYKTCVIGNQIWFAENLAVKHKKGIFGLDLTEYGKECANQKFGRLYNWDEAIKFTPEGWRLPTIDDWKELKAYIKSLNYDVGTALKSMDTWHGSAEKGLDLFGFCAYPTIIMDDVSVTHFWTSSDCGDEDKPKYCVSLSADHNGINIKSHAGCGYRASVRYVKDVE